MSDRNLVTLVIEDNEMFRRLAVDMLNGYSVYSATTASDGLYKFKKHAPHITFIDINLPDANGQSVLSEIKTLNPNAFVVMLTASNLEKDVQESLRNGAKGYIIKPFSRQRIKEYIDKYNATLKQTRNVGNTNKPVYNHKG